MLYLATMLILLIGPIDLYVMDKLDDEIGIIFSVILFVIGCVMFAGVLGSFMSHYMDLGFIKQQDNVIQVYEQRIHNLEKSLNNPMAKNPPVAFMNGDAPKKAYIEAIDKAHQELVDAKFNKEKHIRNIEQRKMGFFWFVTVFYPTVEEVSEETK